MLNKLFKKKSKLIISLGFLILTQVVVKLSQFLFEIGSKTFLSASDYGQFAVYYSIILLVVRVTTWGQGNILLRELEVSENAKGKRKRISTSIQIVSLLSLLIVPVIYIFSHQFLELLLITMVSFLSTILIVLSSVYRSNQYFKLSLIAVDFLKFVMFFIIVIVVSRILNFELSLSKHLFVLLVSCILSVLWVLLDLGRKGIITFIELFQVDVNLLVRQFKSGAPLIFTGFTFLLLSRVDVIMLDYYVEKDVVGEYNLHARIIAQAVFIQQALSVFFLPKLASIVASKDIYQLKRVNFAYVSLAFISTVFIGGSIIFILNLDGVATYLGIEVNFKVLLILYFGHIVYSLLSSSSYLLLYLNKESYEYFNCLLIIFLGVILNLLLIPVYGVVGAAFSTTFAIILGNLLEFFESKYFIRKYI